MNLQENFKLKINDLLFNNSKYITKKRERLLKKISSNDFSSKNNESLKNIDLNKLFSFDYNCEKNDDEPTTVQLDNNTYQVNIINGDCHNYEDKNLKISKITSNEIEILFDQKFDLLNDVIIDLNSIFLNSEFILKVKK